MTLRAQWPAVRAAVQPRPGRWGVVPGLRAVTAAAIVLDVAAAAGLPVGGVAYLGVACAVSFVGAGGRRAQLARVAAQAAGAAVGMTVGILIPATPGWVVAAAVIVGFVAGALGVIGPASTGAAVMAVIGLAYTQFNRLGMPWWEPVLAYLVGSSVLLVLALRERHHSRGAVAAVWEAAADLVTTPDDDGRRRALAGAWTTAYEAATGYRLRPASGPLAQAWNGARDAAAHAARIAVLPSAAAADLARGWRAAAARVRDGSFPGGEDPVHPGTAAPRTPRARDVLRPAFEPTALWTGARIGVCVGVATALAIVLRTPAHAYWIPLTVAVLVRPEYGSVLVRSLHRLAGTIVGVTVVAGLLAFSPTPAWTVAVAALSLGLAAFGATRLYGLAVVGITGSALFSVALTSPAGFDPWARFVDTVLGCAVALVVSVLLWPRRGLLDPAHGFARAAAALATYAEHPETTTADDAYRRAHLWREQLERDLTEPDPTRAAATWLPVALRLEHVVDLVAAAPTAEVAGQLRTRPRTAAEAAILLETVSGRLG